MWRLQQVDGARIIGQQVDQRVDELERDFAEIIFEVDLPEILLESDLAEILSLIRVRLYSSLYIQLEMYPAEIRRSSGRSLQEKCPSETEL